MKKAFVTGATGFLGLNLVEELCESNWDVTALHLPGENLTYLSRFDVTPVPGDILDYETLQCVIPKNMDAIFHVAGDTSTWKKNDERQYQINVLGTANMCKAAIEKNAARFIHTSSSSAFGYHPYRLNELTPSNALDCGMNYNKTKYLAEQVVKRAVDYGLYAVIINPCNIIGPYDPSNWSQIIKSVIQRRMPGYPPGLGTFAHVRDIAEAHLSAVEHGANGANYLLGGVEASFKEVIQEIAKLTGTDVRPKDISDSTLKRVMHLSMLTSFFGGKEPLLNPPKYKRLVGSLTCDDTNARQTLNFKTSSLSEMLNDSYQWLKQEGMV